MIQNDKGPITRTRILKITTITAVVLCGAIIPFIDFLVAIEIFYLAIPLLLLFFGSLAYLFGRLVFGKSYASGLFLAFWVPAFVGSQFVSTYIVGKVQTYRAQQIVKQINITGHVPSDYETFGLEVKNENASNSFTVSYSAGFMTREIYDASSQTWKRLGLSDYILQPIPGKELSTWDYINGQSRTVQKHRCSELWAKENFNFTTNPMTLKNMTSWADYWKTFDALIEKLQRDGHEQIVLKLKDAQRYVNGFTDGWFEFKMGMEKTFELHRTKMKADHVATLKELIDSLADSLARRG